MNPINPSTVIKAAACDPIESLLRLRAARANLEAVRDGRLPLSETLPAVLALLAKAEEFLADDAA